MKKVKFLFFIIIFSSLSCSDSGLEFIALFPEFDLSAEEALVFDEVKMINKSDGEIKSYLWTFQNGVPETSTEVSPTVKFTTTGENEITLTAVNNTVSKTVKSTIKISDDLKLNIRPNFFDIREGQLQSLDVTFAGTDKSIKWTFDNTNHGEFNEENIYFAPQSFRRGSIIKATASFENFPGREKSIQIIHRGQDDFKSCDTFGEITQGDYFMANNMFNTIATNDWSFCSYILDRTNNPIIIWNWDINVDGDGQLIGFPNILYGREQNPTINRNTVSNTIIPARLANFPNTTVQYEFETIDYIGQSRLFIEGFFTNQPTVSIPTEQFLIRIILVNGTPTIPGRILKEDIMINGDSYDLYQDENDDLRPSERSIFSFYPSEVEKSKTLTIQPLINYLNVNNLVAADVYLQNLRIGNEVKNGSGASIIKQFEVRLSQ